MKKKTMLLILALVLLAAALAAVFFLGRPAAQTADSGKRDPVPAPSAADCAEGFFRVVGSFHPGTAGSSLGRAQAACSAYRFAAEHRLAEVDGEQLRAALREGRESLGEEERGWFDENYESVCELIEDCRNGWEELRPLFDDAGAAGEMDALLADPAARASWDKLKQFIE